MTNSTFIDSSAWISYVIPTDSNYQKAVLTFHSFGRKTKLYTSLFIIDETITKIRRALNQKEASRLYEQFKLLEKTKILTILPIDEEVVDKAVLLLEKYPTPNTFSLTDATSLVLIKKLKLHSLFSFDSDFKKIKSPGLRILPSIGINP